MTALSIIQNACSEMSLTPPSALFSSTNDLDIQLRNILNRELTELARDFGWQVLLTEQTFTTVNQAVQTNAVPSDFFWYVDSTMFNRTTNRRVIGPISPNEWQAQKAFEPSSTIDDAFRFRGSDIIITPSPTAGETIAYEYVSDLLCTDSGGAGQTKYSSDDDLSKLDEGLLTMGVIWRFKKAKGFDYAEDMVDYEKAVEFMKSRDGGKKRLSLTDPGTLSRGTLNIPEGNWS